MTCSVTRSVKGSLYLCVSTGASSLSDSSSDKYPVQTVTRRRPGYVTFVNCTVPNVGPRRSRVMSLPLVKSNRYVEGAPKY